MRRPNLLGLLFALAITMGGVTAYADNDWARVKCPSLQELAAELLELQVSGHRVPGAKASCLDQKRFKYTRVLDLTTGEGPGGGEAQMVDEKRPFEIKKLRKLETGDIEVHFVYNIRSGKQTKAVSDVMVFSRYEGYGKPLFGCASAIAEPNTLVIRPSCASR